jgi:hypothetical protein
VAREQKSGRQRIKIQEQEFFAAREPMITGAPNAAARGRLIAALKSSPEGSREFDLHEEFETAKRVAEAASVFARIPESDHGRFLLTGRGDVNTYALFSELFFQLVSERGRAGIVVPNHQKRRSPAILPRTWRAICETNQRISRKTRYLRSSP